MWSDPGAFSQVEFAEFLDENARDIREPSAAAMLDLVRTFKSNRKQSFNSVVYPANGDITLAFDDKATEGSTVMPEMLAVGIPVYFMGSAYKLGVFVRYKVGNGVVFSLKPDRADIIEADAFAGLRETITTETGIATYLGWT